MICFYIILWALFPKALGKFSNNGECKIIFVTPLQCRSSQQNSNAISIQSNMSASMTNIQFLLVACCLGNPSSHFLSFHLLQSSHPPHPSVLMFLLPALPPSPPPSQHCYWWMTWNEYTDYQYQEKVIHIRNPYSQTSGRLKHRLPSQEKLH